MNTILPYSVYACLGDYIKKSFFGDEAIGNQVFPIVDTPFIRLFCKEYDISYEQFISYIQDVNVKNITSTSPIVDILGFIGIQLWAVSIMEEDDDHACDNFRARLCSDKILNIDALSWDKWAKKYQDKMWKVYYSWCEHKGFIIVNKCTPGFGAGRYVQYPKHHAMLILNNDDLKRIARIFVEKKLQPKEDLGEEDFWKIIRREHCHKEYYSGRSLKILNIDRKIANKQIYQYYLAWNGEYIQSDRLKKVTKDRYKLLIHNDSECYYIDIVEIDTENYVEEIKLTSMDAELANYYNFKRDGIILFKHSYDYDGYWEETRYLENEDDEGLALFDNMKRYDNIDYIDIVRQFPKYVLVKISNKLKYKKFYAKSRPFALKGGLKIKMYSNTYLMGAPPYLEFKKAMSFWVDGEQVESPASKYILSLNEGCHHINIEGYKSIEINIKNISPDICPWAESVKWKFNIQKRLWKPSRENGDIIGLDFSTYSKVENELEDSGTALSNWCDMLLFNKRLASSSENVVLKMLNDKY